jgi:hypothetical protein
MRQKNWSASITSCGPVSDRPSLRSARRSGGAPGRAPVRHRGAARRLVGSGRQLRGGVGFRGHCVVEGGHTGQDGGGDVVVRPAKAEAQCGRDGPQSREGLEEAPRPRTPGPLCRLLGRLARHVGGRVVRSEERRNWTGHTNSAGREQPSAKTGGFLDATLHGVDLKYESHLDRVRSPHDRHTYQRP